MLAGSEGQPQTLYIQENIPKMSAKILLITTIITEILIDVLLSLIKYIYYFKIQKDYYGRISFKLL